MNQNERFTQGKFTRRRMLEMGGASAFVLATAAFSPASPERADSDKSILLKSYTSDFTNSEPYRVKNIVEGSNAINNYFWNFDGSKDKDGNLNKFGKNLINPGEIFSIDSILGKVDNYVIGYAIGANQQPEAVYGGGICQIPTTLFVASINAGLSIKERRNHSYYFGWYVGGENDPKEMGQDATVYMSDPDTPVLDLKILNTYDFPIRFFFKSEDDHLQAGVYGPPGSKLYHTEIEGPRMVFPFEGMLVKDMKRWTRSAATTMTQRVWKNQSKEELLVEQQFDSYYQSSPYPY